jgi:hypothetical protein
MQEILQRTPRRRPLIIAMLAMLATLLGGVAFPAQAHAKATTTYYYQIVSRQNDQCLAVWGGATQHAANVGVATCSGAAHEQWYLQTAYTDSSGTYYYIRVRHTGMCLNVAYYGQENGSDVVQATCSNGTNEQWRLVPTDGGYYRLIARNSGKCLDKAANSDVVQWQCWGTWEWWQHWKFALISVS